jgi:hypothetical protein
MVRRGPQQTGAVHASQLTAQTFAIGRQRARRNFEVRANGTDRCCAGCSDIAFGFSDRGSGNGGTGGGGNGRDGARSRRGRHLHIPIGRRHLRREERRSMRKTGGMLMSRRGGGSRGAEPNGMPVWRSVGSLLCPISGGQWHDSVAQKQTTPLSTHTKQSTVHTHAQSSRAEAVNRPVCVHAHTKTMDGWRHHPNSEWTIGGSTQQTTQNQRTIKSHATDRCDSLTGGPASEAISERAVGSGSLASSCFAAYFFL